MAEPGGAMVPELSVTDWQASRAFYCDLLGFACLYDRPDEGFAYLALGEAQLMLDQYDLGRSFDPGLGPADRPFGRGMNLQIRVPALAPLLGRLADAGVAPHLGPEDRWYRRGAEEVGNRQVIVADPDGYLLRLYEDLGARPLAAGGLAGDASGICPA
ncbi:bleomycin resistance protein [Frigidibacter sp. MR17.24]|uniref:bleomycin resistance protein n=1 Tax=Frigidibacter sp. MR17.24 TaxID=3127345 RepID=UPI003012AA86